MITEEKIKAVKKQLRSGAPQGEIKNDLRKDGYTEEDIDQVFVPHKPDMRSWYLIFAIIFLITGFYVVMTRGYLLVLVFPAAMFWVYYIEKKRIKNESN